MYISYNWLKDFIKVPAKLSPEEMAAKLTNQTVEVEGVNRQANQFNRVVIGQVLEVSKHPKADRLRLALVDVKKEKLRIVCGAPNLAVGQLVPVALVGAVLPNGLEIKETEIRGEKSGGMICAEDELGLGKNHEGIMVLGTDAKIGVSFAKYLKADDIVFEVDNKSLSNRPDLLCHYGIARELSVILGVSLKPLEKFLVKIIPVNGPKKELDVKIEDKDLCLRYSAIKISNIEVKDSPAWLKQRLVAVGQRPLNNIVDLTNYVMLDIGQPLHAFDAAKVDKIIVRRATKEESLETLDGRERLLTNEDLVIASSHGAVALAGIMGGAASEVRLETKEIILESANFKATAIRKTSQKLALRSEASSRFEKSLDPALTELAIKRFIFLLKDVCPDFQIASNLIDLNNIPTNILEIDLALNWLALKIGQEIPREQILSIFDKLGFKIQDRQADILRVTIPSWRATKDIRTREDLVEEVLRFYGYDNIESKMPVQVLNIPVANQERQLERKIKNVLAFKYDLDEVYNYSFVGEEQLKKNRIDFSRYLRLINPLSDLQSLLRQSLVPGLLANIKTNQARNINLGFFEIGNVFFGAPGDLKKDEANDTSLPHQEKHLGLAWSSDEPELFSHLKGIVKGLLQTITNYNLEVSFIVIDNKPGWADEQMTAGIIFLDQEIGQLALLNPTVASNLNLKKPVVLAEINFSLLFNLITKLSSFRFQEAAKYPALSRDLAFVVNDKILYNDLRKDMVHFHPLIKGVELFDVYSGSRLASGQKSLAFHLIFQSEEKTLTAGEVDKIQQELINHLGQKFAAQLRDF